MKRKIKRRVREKESDKINEKLMSFESSDWESCESEMMAE